MIVSIIIRERTLLIVYTPDSLYTARH